MKFAVVVFPGSNCDHDAYHATKHVLGQDAVFVWHKEVDLKGADAVILPGGFAHGDYLRTGAIARFSPIMPSVVEFARRGGPVLGICNGFQILLEAGLLPGAMLRNRDLKYRCEHVIVRVEQTDTSFTLQASRGQRLRLPIAHGEGNYYRGPRCTAAVGGPAPGDLPLLRRARRGDRGGKPEWFGRQHCRHLQRGTKRRWPDAAPRACVRGPLGSADGLVMLESVVTAVAREGAVRGA